MTKMLFAKGGVPYSPMSPPTTKLAYSILSASMTLARHLPHGIVGSSALNILLSLYVAEEDARYLSVGDLMLAGDQPAAVTERWIAHLVQSGLVDRQEDVLALSIDGHRALTDALEAMFAAQRALD